MVATNEFTTSEAAALVEQPVNRIQKFIDVGTIARRAKRGERPTRVLTDADVMFMWVITRAMSGIGLTKDVKAVLYEKIAENREGFRMGRVDEVRINDFLAVRDLRKLTGELLARIARLLKARDMVAMNPKIKGGEPVIKGTRIPVYLVAAMLDQGASTREIAESYPSLNEETIELARVYARANPKQGRPKHAWHSSS